MIVTDRDLEIVAAVGSSVRCMTLVQIADVWWPATLAGFKNAAKRVAQLVDADLLRSEAALAHPLLLLDQPLFAWRPTDEAPPFARLSWRLQSRRTAHPVHSRVYYCSPRDVTLLGTPSAGKLKNLCQVTHDLHVSQIYLAYRRRWPDLVVDWVGEEAYRAQLAGEKIPDALLVSQGQTYRAVEFGGRYPPTRLASLHADFARHQLPYEIW